MSAQSSKTRLNSEKETASRNRAPRTLKPLSVMTPPVTMQRAVADPEAARPADVQTLQRSYGNRAVQRLLAGRAVQAKLHVGPAGDTYEQEADRVADRVMKMPAPESVSPRPMVQRQSEEEEVQTKPLAATISQLVQRQAEEEEEVQTKAAVQRQTEEEEVQTQRQGPGDGFEAGSEIEGQLSAQKGAGSPLPAEVRSFMEPRFGADFSGVRVHTGSDASQLNRQLSAQAFTHGQDIYMGGGKYSPGSGEGQRLLAHELTHVVQQTGAQLSKKPVPQAGLQRIAAITPASTSGPRIQRALDFEGTDWSATSEVLWVKGRTSDLAPNSNVLCFKSGESKLWVKTGENVSQGSAMANLINIASQVRSGRKGGEGGWKLSTPQIRPLDMAERMEMSNSLRITGATPQQMMRIQLVLRHRPGVPVQVSTHAGGEKGGKETEEDVWAKASKVAWIKDRGFRKTLGYAALMDIIIGNWDRIISQFGPQNWKVQKNIVGANVLHLIDNIYSVGGFTQPFNVWNQLQQVNQVRNRQFQPLVAFYAQNYWTGEMWDAITDKEAWIADFQAGLEQAYGDLPTTRTRLAQSMAGKMTFELSALLRRIDYLLGVAPRVPGVAMGAGRGAPVPAT